MQILNKIGYDHHSQQPLPVSCIASERLLCYCLLWLCFFCLDKTKLACPAHSGRSLRVDEEKRYVNKWNLSFPPAVGEADYIPPLLIGIIVKMFIICYSFNYQLYSKQAQTRFIPWGEVIFFYLTITEGGAVVGRRWQILIMRFMNGPLVLTPVKTLYGK